MSMYNKKSVEDIDVKGKKVIVRVDFNVPFDAEGNITDDKRIVGALPTIKYLADHEAKVILVSHLGRPKGQFNTKYSMAPASKRLGELLGKEVIQASDVIGADAEAKTAHSRVPAPQPVWRRSALPHYCRDRHWRSRAGNTIHRFAPGYRSAHALPP